MSRIKTELGMSIVEFFECGWLLNIKELSPIQKVILKSIMGDPLDTENPIMREHPYQDKDFQDEVDMYLHFTGKNEYEPDFHPDVDLCLGRRSGKSTLIGAGLAIYFATQIDYGPFLRTSPNATIPIISPTKDQAGEVYRSIKQMLLRSPYLYNTYLDGKLEAFEDEYSEENVADGRLTGGQIVLNNSVIIKVMAADISKIRGMAVPFAILDEVCFFGTESNDQKNTDKGIYEALAPALTQFQEVEGMAMILKISSPNGQAGLMFEDYEKCTDRDILHFQVPTWWANPRISVNYLEKQKKKGMSFFNREYGAQYTASETSYLDPGLIDECIIKGAEEIDYEKGYRYVAAMDYATKDDYWAFAIGHKEYITDPESKEKLERVQIDYIKYWRGISGQELNPAEVIPEIALHMKKYKVVHCVTDQYAFAPLKALFQREGVILKEFKVATQSKLKYMYSLQVAINSGVLKMVHNPLAVRHLKDLRQKVTQGGKLKVEHAANCHDDLADAIGLVVYQFDKNSPLYIGLSREEDYEERTTKDGRGQHLAYPLAEEVAQRHGVHQFYDNRAEFEEKKKEEDDDDDNFFFAF